MPEGERGYCGWFVPDFVALSLERERTGAIWGEWLGRDAFVRAEDDTRGG